MLDFLRPRTATRLHDQPLDIVPVPDMISTALSLLTDPQFFVDAMGRSPSVIVLSSVCVVAAAYVQWR